MAIPRPLRDKRRRLEDVGNKSMTAAEAAKLERIKRRLEDEEDEDG